MCCKIYKIRHVASKTPAFVLALLWSYPLASLYVCPYPRIGDLSSFLFVLSHNKDWNFTSLQWLYTTIQHTSRGWHLFKSWKRNLTSWDLELMRMWSSKRILHFVTCRYGMGSFLILTLPCWREEEAGPNASEGEGEDAKRAARRLDQPHNKETDRTSDK